VLRGKGDGTFGLAVSSFVAGSPWSLAVGDFNGDGRPDIAAVALFVKVSLLINKGGGAFDFWIDVPAGELPRYLALADVNGDGKADLIVANGDVSVPASAKNYISVLTNGCEKVPRHRPARH